MMTRNQDLEYQLEHLDRQYEEKCELASSLTEVRLLLLTS